MQVEVWLHGILRDHLPPEAKGRGTVTLPEGATLADLLARLGITRSVEAAVNEAHEADQGFVLHEGDAVTLFMVIGGG